MTQYTFLYPYNRQGVPSTLNVDPLTGSDITQTPSTDLLSEISSTLSEGKRITQTHPDWIRKSDLHIVEQCDVSVTFLDEGAGYRNGMGYYVYDRDSPPSRFSDISDIYVIFPNCSKSGSGGAMTSGDTIRIPYTVDSVQQQTVNNRSVRVMDTATWSFPAGMSIGFVCFANKWRNNGSSHAYLSVGHNMYSSNPVLNPEGSEDRRNHFVNFQSQVHPDKIIYGVEDIHRDSYHCDHDFNDLVFEVNASPLGAVDPSCINSVTSQSFTGTIICEDLLNKPDADYDYNDLVLKYTVTETLDGDRVISLLFLVEGMTRGAALDHNFGVVIPNIKSSNATIFSENFVSSTFTSSSKNLTLDIIGGNTDRVPIIESTKAFLPNGSIWATNTINGTQTVSRSHARMRVVFPAGGISRSDLNNVTFPYNFYLEVKKPESRGYFLYSDLLYDDVSEETKAGGVASKHKIIIIPGLDNFRVPFEKQPLRNVYFRFPDYLSGNLKYIDWYLLKHAKQQSLYPAVPDGGDTHAWSPVLDTSNTPTSGSLHLIDLAFDSSGTYTWSGESVTPILTKYIYSLSDLTDWTEINTTAMIDAVVNFVKSFGSIHVLYNDTYKDSSDKYYYVSVASLASNANRTIHHTLQGTSESLELLSKFTTYRYTMVNSSAGAD